MVLPKPLNFGQPALPYDALDEDEQFFIQLICDRILEGVDVNLHVGLIAVQPHVGIADVPLHATPLVSGNSFSGVVIVDRTTKP